MSRRCEICKIDIQDEYSYQGHIQGKKHLKNAHHVEIMKSLTQRSIFVTPIPTNIPLNSVIHFFSHFGKIIKYWFGPNHIIIEFQNKEPVSFLLSEPVYFYGVKLNIHPRIISDNRTSSKTDKKNIVTINDTEDLLYDNIKSIFEVESNFDQQLKAFIDKIIVNENEIQTYYESTCAKLNEIFRSIFPKCRVYRFGSTVTGLGFKNCDLDIYLDVGFPISHENQYLGPNVVPATTVFSEVKRMLFARSNIFSKVVPIPRAKTPIIKFIYLPKNISCDISFKNSLAIHNSQLVKFYLSIDSILRPTMIILKYWVNNFELKHGGKISKYALTLLFIFYLQQPSIKLVPPIEELKQRCVPKIVDGWQVNFDMTYRNCGNTMNKMTIPELLKGFFNFYANYNFKRNIVCPIDGISHNVTEFNEVDNLPKSMDRYKVYLKVNENPVVFPVSKPMCVQDPYELNYNTTGNVCTKYLEIFQKYCAAAEKICERAMEKNYKDLLPSLLSLIIKINVENLNASFLIKANNLLTVGLPKDFHLRTDIVDKDLFIRENWCNLVIHFIKRILEDVLKFNVELKNLEQEQKQQKIEVESDVHSKGQEKTVMHCVGNYCLWKNRKNIKGNIFDPSMSLIEKEIQISENLFKLITSDNNCINTSIDFDFVIIRKEVKNTHLIISLLNNDCTKNTFIDLTNYLKSKIPHIIIKTLKHMQQFQKVSID